MSDTSQLVALADKVKDELNNAPAGTFVLAFVAARAYVPQFDLPALKDLQVTVAPLGQTTTPATRASDDDSLRVQVGVQKRVDPNDLDAVDQLMLLAEQIARYLRRKRHDLGDLDDGTKRNAAWTGNEHDPVYIVEHLLEDGVFTSVITASHKLIVN